MRVQDLRERSVKGDLLFGEVVSGEEQHSPVTSSLPVVLAIPNWFLAMQV